MLEVLSPVIDEVSTEHLEHLQVRIIEMVTLIIIF